MNPSRGGADDWGSSAEPPSVRSAWLGCYWQAERRPPGFWVDASANCRNLAVHRGGLSTWVISATCRRSLPYRLPHGHPGDAGPLCQFALEGASDEREHGLAIAGCSLADASEEVSMQPPRDGLLVGVRLVGHGGLLS